MQENLQQAEKLYFKSGKLSPKVKEIVLHITGGDSYTKIIADMYFAELVQSNELGDWMLSGWSSDENSDTEPTDNNKDSNDILHIDTLRELKASYIQLKEYNKNIFPIKNLFNYSSTRDILYIISALKQRKQILELIKTLPSVAIRNLKNDIRQERDYKELQDYRHLLEHFIAHLSLLDNRSDKIKNVFFNKIFKSNTTLNDLINFIEDKGNFLGGYKFSKNSVKKLIGEDGYDLELVYENGNIMVVDVTSPEGIKKIGCNSFWCFTYGSGFDDAYRNWNNYSTNDHVYTIIDFSHSSDDENFMHVLIKPLDYDSDTQNNEEEGDTTNHDKLFNMANEMQDAPLNIIDRWFSLEKAKNIFHFDIQSAQEPQTQQKTKSKFVDPNQLSLGFPEPGLRQVAELRKKVRSVLREAMSSENNPFAKYKLSTEEYKDAMAHINNVLKYGKTNFTFSEFDTTKYYSHKAKLNAIFDYLALNYHTQKKSIQNNIHSFLFTNLVPTNKHGELNAVGKILYTILRNHIPTGQIPAPVHKISKQQEKQNEAQLNEDYPGEDLDTLRNIYYNPETGFNKALSNYHHQNASFVSFLLTILSQKMIDNYKKKSFQSNGVRTPFKTYSLDEPIDFNQYTGNKTTGENRPKINYNTHDGSSSIKFADALKNIPDEKESSDQLDGINMQALKRVVVDFILSKLALHNKTVMLQLFRQMYILGEKDINTIAQALNITPLNVRVTKNRFEAFITKFVESGEFQKFIKSKTGKTVQFPNNEFKTNKSYLSE